MKKLLIAIAMTVALVGPAMACDPPTVGDKYTKDGVTYVVVKLLDQCGDNFYARPDGAKRPYRKVRRLDVDEDNWTFLQKK
jgi:hypothetical protein